MADKPYKGALLTPMRKRPGVNLLAEMLRNPNYGTESDETIRREVEEKFEKLKLLFEHYGIDQHDPIAFGKLALLLAERHVPGFRRMKDRAGPKTKWTEIDRAELSIEIDCHIAKALSKNAKRMTRLQAAEELHAWPAYAKRAASAKALLKQATLASPKWIEMVRKAAAYDESVKENKLGRDK